MGIFDIFYLTYVALTQSLFVKVFFMFIIYSLQYINSIPTKNWYGYDDHKESFMPRYNLNHQDVDTIVAGLNHMSMNARSSKEHSRITNLKHRLLSKLSSKNQEDQDYSDDDVWQAFQGDD